MNVKGFVFACLATTTSYYDVHCLSRILKVLGMLSEYSGKVFGSLGNMRISTMFYKHVWRFLNVPREFLSDLLRIPSTLSKNRFDISDRKTMMDDGNI